MTPSSSATIRATQSGPGTINATFSPAHDATVGKEELIAAEGNIDFDLQRFVSCVHDLTGEKGSLRYLYFQAKLGGFGDTIFRYQNAWKCDLHRAIETSTLRRSSSERANQSLRLTRVRQLP
jgi:hypothetical protein